MKKIVAITVLSFFLAACDSDDKADPSNIEEPSLSEISAVWEWTRISGDKEEQQYLVVKDHGQIIYYDYDGDSWDQGEDCYYKTTKIITDLGSGNFEIINDDGEYGTSRVSLVDNTLTILGESDTTSFPKSSKNETDFTPLCEDSIIDLSRLRDPTIKPMPTN